MSTESWKKIHSALESYAALASHMNDEVCQSYYGEWQRALEAVDVAEEEENRIADLEAAIALQAERVMELEEALQWIEAIGRGEWHGRGLSQSGIASRALSATAREDTL